MTQDIFQLLHACDKCTHEAAFFQNILRKFLKNFQKFCTFLTKNPTHTLTFQNRPCHRKQRVTLNGQCLSWADIHAGAPQGSIFRHLLFLIDQQFIKSATVYFHETLAKSTGTHKHLGMRINSKLSYENHLHSVFSRVKKTIGLLRKCQPTLPRNSLATICKSFIRPHLDYGGVIYD